MKLPYEVKQDAVDFSVSNVFIQISTDKYIERFPYDQMICTHCCYSSFKAFTKLFRRQLRKFSIGQFFLQKHLHLCQTPVRADRHTRTDTHTHTHSNRLSQMQMWILSVI